MNDIIIILTLACISLTGVLLILRIKHCHPPRRSPLVKTYKEAAMLAALITGIGIEAGTAEEPQNFNAKEWTLDAYGTGRIANDSRNKNDVKTGAGVGLTYWATRGLGFGVRGESEGLGHSTFDSTAGRISFRAPLWDAVAPYGYVEGGYQFERERWQAGAGGGVEWRFAKRWGVFAESGLQVTTRGEGEGKGAIGLRLKF